MREVAPRTTRLGLASLAWPIVAVIVVQTLIAALSIYTMSAVRAYVGGESLWSKGYMEAIYQLHNFAETGDAAHFAAFEREIAVPLADRSGRIALQSTPIDLDAAKDGFLGGGNHPDDIAQQIWLFRYFQDVVYLREAIEHWTAADRMIVALADMARSIRLERALIGNPDAARIAEWQGRIDGLKAEVRPLTDAFAASLGRGSRAITWLLFAANLATATILVLLGVMRLRSLLNQRAAVVRALRAERERAQVTLSSIGQAVVSTDAEGRVNYMNRVAERLLGVSMREAGQAKLSHLFEVGNEGGPNTEQIMARLLNAEPVASTPSPRMLTRRDGAAMPVSIVGSPLLSDGRATGSVIVLNDMTREKEFIDQLSWQATHDALTSLANRRAFEAAISAKIAQLGSQPSSNAVMFIDLDQFKIVNDTCGHAAGDALLRLVAGSLRPICEPVGTLARLGGDEFGFLLGDASPAAAAGIAETIRRTVEQLDFHWNDRMFRMTASIGVVELSSAMATLEDTLRGADVACYVAKDKGRNRVHIHRTGDGELQERVGEMAWVERIHRAIAEDRFVLFFQPIMALQTGAAGQHVGILLRLSGDDGALVPPGAFIGPAERYGLMPLVDRWVVGATFRVLAAREAAKSRPLITTCAINLSGQTVADAGFADFVRRQFELHGISPRRICFEITETSAIERLDLARAFIDEMREIGCRFSLDDFGAGMSSFNYLKSLPVDYLKIDGSFVRDMLHDEFDRATVEMIHRLGKLTGKQTVAEIVEDEATLFALREIGVDFAQGYVIAAPAPFLVAAEDDEDAPRLKRRAGHPRLN